MNDKAFSVPIWGDFLVYDPVATFSPSRPTCFAPLPTALSRRTVATINSDVRKADCEALLCIGSEAFSALGFAVTPEAFETNRLNYIQTLRDVAMSVVTAYETGRLSFACTGLDGDAPPTGQELVALLTDGALLQIANLEESIGWKHRTMASKRAEFFAFASLFELEEAVIHFSSPSAPGGLFSVMHATEAAITAQHLLDSNITELSFSRRRASRAAHSRWRGDPRLVEKAFVRECWERWKASPGSYVSKAAFAKDVLDKCEHLTSQKVIEDWCRDWDKGKPEPC